MKEFLLFVIKFINTFLQFIYYKGQSKAYICEKISGVSSDFWKNTDPKIIQECEYLIEKDSRIWTDYGWTIVTKIMIINFFVTLVTFMMVILFGILLIFLPAKRVYQIASEFFNMYVNAVILYSMVCFFVLSIDS